MSMENQPHWDQLLRYRQQAVAWQQRGLNLPQTRLRVAKLLEVAFGYDLDDVEVEVAYAGCTADFVLQTSGTPWASVIVRPMAAGLDTVPPSEAFLIADAGKLHWCWLTDGVSIHLYHVGRDLALSRLVRCHVVEDAESDLRAAWRLLHHQGQSSGDLDAYRQSRERPDDEAVAAAVLAEPVLLALRDALARDFPSPGTPEELAGQVRRLFRTTKATHPVPAERPTAEPPPAPPPAEESALACAGTAPEDAPPPAPVIAAASDVPAVAHVPSPIGRAPSLAAILPRRRRSTAWRYKEGADPVGVPALGASNGSAREAPTVSDADGEDDPGAAADRIPPTRATLETEPNADLVAAAFAEADDVAEGPAATLTAGSPEPATDADPPKGKAGPGRRKKTTEPRRDNLMSMLERQRQSHQQLRQNLQDLRENRERLADALAELRQDYPERFAALLQQSRQPAPSPPAPAWTLATPLPSLGNGSWEAPQPSPTSPWIRRN